MNEDEYFEENVLAEDIPTNLNIRESLKCFKNEKVETEAMDTSDQTDAGRTEAVFTTAGTSHETIQKIDPKTDESSKDGEEATPGMTRRSGGRQKNQRARKCVMQPPVAPPPAVIDDNVYSEELGGGWARCYSGYKTITKEKAIQQVDPQLLTKILASASKPPPIIEEQNRKGKITEETKKKKRTHDETPSTRNSERLVSPLKLKSPSRGMSEIPSTSGETTKLRAMSREKSETSVVVEKKKKDVEETKEERRERRRREKEMEKENNEKDKIRRRETLEKKAKEDEPESRKKKDKIKKREEETSEAIDISNWEDEKITNHFGLKRVAVIIKKLTQETIDAALQYEPPEKRSRSPRMKQNFSRRALIDSDSSPSHSPVPPDSQPNSRLTPDVLKPFKEKKKRRIEESADIIESPSSPPPPRSPSPESSSSNDIRKKSKSIVRKCVGCHKNLHDCVELWYKTLGAESQYCSVECVEIVVEKIREV